MDNQAIADNFSLLSKLMDIHGENSFKSKGYSIAAYNIERLSAPLEDLSQTEVFALKGIGDGLGKKIMELNQTGELKALRDLIDKTPTGVLDMMQIKGLGPKKVATLWKDLSIESLGELLYACTENRLTSFKGFGAKSQANIKESIEFYFKNQDRFLWADIEPFALEVTEAVRKAFPAERTELTGAFRRQMEVIDELEWVTTVDPPMLDVWLREKGMRQRPPMIWHPATPENFGSRLFATTGSKDYLEDWSSIPAAATEEAIFKAAGLPFVIAPMREAPRRTAAEVIQPGDIKGIIHSHSDWSDGAHTLEKMATEAKARGLEYLVISDHSKSAFYANGLSEDRIKAQHELVDELNARLAPFKIFKSIESDILNDGRLDYSDSVLSTFDLVIASVHSNLSMPLEKAMPRLIAALSNPFTTILGHPTGRLLLSRRGYAVDHRALLDVCAQEIVVMELNAHPRRLDMDWRWLGDAMDKGVLTSIDPDAHSVEGFKDIRYGVLVAQKVGLTAAQNLSSFSLVELENWLAERKIVKGI